MKSCCASVAENGLEMPLPLRIRLSQGPVPAIALALRRLTDLTYGPTPVSRDMTAALLARQRPQGGFAAGDADEADPLATATAVAALNQILADHPAAATDTVISARDRALAALAGMQDDEGLFRCVDDRSDTQRGLVAAFILSLLASDEKFRPSVRWADLMSWFEQRLHRLDSDTTALYRLARAADPTRRRHRRTARRSAVAA